MRPEAALCVVLAVLPLLVLGVTLGCVVMYATPLGPGFGLVAVLAGVDGRDLRVVRGAALSGTLGRQVRLGVEISEVVGRREAGRLVRFRLGEVRDGGGGGTTSKRRSLWKRFTQAKVPPGENVEVLLDDNEEEGGEDTNDNNRNPPKPKPEPNHRLVASVYTTGTIDDYDAASGRESRSESTSGASGVARNNLENGGGGGGRRRATVRSVRQRIERGVVYH